MLEIKNLNAWLAKTRAAKEKVKVKATEHVKSQVLRAFKVVLRESPQYSGDFASNWNIVTSAYGAPGYQETAYKGLLEDAALKYGAQSDRYLRMLRGPGHPDAIKTALSHATDVVASIKWNSKISFVNTAPISDDIATGQLNPPYRPIHAHLESQSFALYIKQLSSMKWIK